MRFNRLRLYIIIIFLFLGFSFIISRAFYFQVLPNSKLKALKSKQYSRIVTLQPTRGLILDRNKKELASSMTAYSLFADPSILENPKQVSQRLSKILKIKSSVLYKSLSHSQKKFVWIERKMTQEKKNAISELKIKGLGFVEESKRIYPNQNLLAHTLGFVGREGQGLEGLEVKFNEDLSGAQKNLLIQRDARGRPLLVSGKLFSDQPDGSNVELTIDREFQYVLEQELKKTVQEYSADGAFGIVMEAKSNEILAMSSYPDFNPNNPWQSQKENRRNRLITDPFEPGSTLKPFIVAGALRRGFLKPNTKFYGEKGRIKVGNRIIKESSESHRFEWLTASEILSKSSNIGMVKIGFRLKEKETHKILEDFGFGHKTGVMLGGESRGIVPPLPWREVKLANISFGQGIATSALQIANAYAAIANGGVLKEPLLVRAIEDPSTGKREEYHSKVIRRVLSEDQARTMLLMMMGVTQDGGTAMNAKITGFPVAGKTGTAQKVDSIEGGYKKGAYISSFAGIVPANDPRFVIFIAVDNPQKKYYGSEVAVPVFTKIANYSLRKDGIRPVLLTEKDIVGTEAKISKKTRNLVHEFAEKINQDIPKTEDEKWLGLTVREVLEKAHGEEANVQIFGQGRSYRVISSNKGPMEKPAEIEAVESQNPNPSKKSETVRVYFK